MFVTNIDLAQIFAPLKEARGIVLALSGGPDSVAALALLNKWPDHPPLYAATFDHGLRPQSRAEAENCATLCAKLGIEHQILTWEGVKPATRIQEEARAARYAALLDYARRKEADHLVTAHHADDQVETILFRMIRGSSIGGLAGMKATSSRGKINITRPLLSMRKSELIAICDAQGLPYIRDQSNEDPRFARTQMRRLATLMEEAGMEPEAFARLSQRAGRAEEALAHATNRLIARAVTQRQTDATRIHGAKLKEAPAELVLRLLIAEISHLGQKPRLEQAEPLADQLHAALSQGLPFRATLGGVLIDLRRDSALVITRESPRKSGL